MSPGWRTSEFWTTLAVHLLNAFTMSGVMVDTHWSVRLASTMSSALVQFGYTMGRTKLKEKHHAKGK